MRDEIVEQIRKVREEHAAKFNYDLAAIFNDLKLQEDQDGRKTMSLSPKKPTPLSNKRDKF